VISLLFIPRYFEGRLATVYQLLQSRFGLKVRALAASLFIVTRTVGDGVRLLLTAIVFAGVYRAFQSGADPRTLVVVSIVAVGLVMIVFTFAGGIEAVVWIEVAQLAIYIAAAVVIAQAIPGGLPEAIAIGARHQKFRLFDFAFDIHRTYGFWAGLIGGCFLTMSTHGTDQYMVQRYLCTDSRRHATVALLTSGVLVLAQFIGFLFIGVLLFAYYRPFDAPGYTAGAAAAPFVAGDQVFPDFITNHLPTGVSGLVVAAIFAAAMSSSLSAIASTAIADLYAPIAHGRGDRHYLNVSRVFVVIAGVAQIGFALMLHGSTRSALDTALGIASLVNGPILGVFLLGAVRRGGPAAALIGMLGGLAAVLPLRFLTEVAWPWYAVVGSITTLLVGTAADVAIAALRRR
jgi:Na+/proline symporter